MPPIIFIIFSFFLIFLSNVPIHKKKTITFLFISKQPIQFFKTEDMVLFNRHLCSLMLNLQFIEFTDTGALDSLIVLQCGFTTKTH